MHIRIEKGLEPSPVKIIDVDTGKEVPRVVGVSIKLLPGQESCVFTLEAESFEFSGEFEVFKTKEVK